MIDNLNFQTPDWVCDILVGLLPSNAKTILEPTKGRGNLVAAIGRRFPSAVVYAPALFEQFDIPFVDCIVANPPFTPMQTGYDLLTKFFTLSPNIVVLMPWLSLINSEKRTGIYIQQGLKEIHHLPRRAFNGSRVQTCILVFCAGYKGNIVFKYQGALNV